MIQDLDTNAHVSVSTDLSQYTLGQTIVIQGTLTFTANETAAINRVRLTNTSGPQPLDVNLPVGDTGGVFMDLSSGVAGTLLVRVSFTGVTDVGGTVQNTFTGPSTDLDGIASLNDFLWILENGRRDFDTVDPTGSGEHRIFKTATSTVPSTDSGWGALTKIRTSSNFEQYLCITAEGSGASGTLWLVRRNPGDKFVHLQQSGSEISSFFTNPFVNTSASMAFSADSLYTSIPPTATRLSDGTRTRSKSGSSPPTHPGPTSRE